MGVRIALEDTRMSDFCVIFASVPDPRDINARHDLREMLFIGLGAMLCGAESCVEMAQFGENRRLFFAQSSNSSTVCRATTLSLVFSGALTPLRSRMRSSASWKPLVGRLLPAPAHLFLAVDGESRKCAYELVLPGHTPPMLVTVWGTQMRMTFAQTPAGEGGDAEAAIALLPRLSLTGCVVTADAIHCDRRTVETVKQRGGDYVIALKLNQRKLYATVAALIDEAGSRATSAETCEDGHGRHERRSIFVAAAPGLAREHGFKGLTAVARVVSERTVDGKTTREERLLHRLPSFCAI